jgi:hypothetical protein
MKYFCISEAAESLGLSPAIRGVGGSRCWCGRRWHLWRRHVVLLLLLRWRRKELPVYDSDKYQADYAHHDHGLQVFHEEFILH